MVSGTTTFPNSIGQAVEDKLSSDAALKTDCQEISTRFHHVYADPQAAFKAVNVDAMLVNEAVAAATITKIAEQPESFGALKGKTGLFAGPAQAQARDTAFVNAPALARDLQAFIAKRSEAASRYEAEERAVRLKLSLDIPALSASAKQVLERVRDAIDRNDVPAGLEYALADRQVKAELEGFAKVVTERFGRRIGLFSPKPAPVAPPTSNSINRSAAKPIILRNKSASALFSTSERTFIMSLVIGDLSIRLVLNNPTLNGKH